MDNTTGRRLNCRHCVHFYITWEKRCPYGCRFLGFKSRLLPSLEVFRSSGNPCLSFVRKENDQISERKGDARKSEE